MKDIGDKIKTALIQAIEESGGRPALAKKTGLAYSMIHRFSTGECEIGNMTVGTLNKLFPDMELFFSGRNAFCEQIHRKEEELDRLRRQLEFEREILMLEQENWRLMKENRNLKKRYSEEK